MKAQRFGHGLIIQSFLSLMKWVAQFQWRECDLSSMSRAITVGLLAFLSNSPVQKGDAELRQMFCCSSSSVGRLFIPHLAHGL